MQEWFGFGLVALAALTLGLVWGQRQSPSKIAGILMLGILLRIVGSSLRLAVMEEVYSGVGDAKMYIAYGKLYADRLQNLDVSFAFGADSPTGRWWGTQFVKSVTGFVVFFTGDSIRAAFLVFALLSFLGLVLAAKAVREVAGPDAELTYARWVWLWPSLWFWPCSVGKEALMLLAAGLVARGYVGTAGRSHWATLASGLAIAASIRPHVAAVIACAVLFAEMTRPGRMLTPRRLAGLALAGVIAAFSVNAGLDQLGLGDADLEGIQEQFEFRSGQTAQGGSQITRISGPAAVPMAFATILLRPFPWEARGAAALSSAEISLFWLLVVLRRRALREALAEWRSDAFMRLAAPLVGGVSLLYGLAFANLGIIARQRAIVLPFLLLLLVARAQRQREVAQEWPQLARTAT